jgi:cytochrome c oxidase assembly protein subunit 15
MNQFKRADRSRPVAIWIMIGVDATHTGYTWGITRLTGSGLSITEWNVVTKLLLPLNDQQWMIEFEKYRQTPQFQIINTHFTLSDFKFIFSGSDSSVMGKLIAVAFLVPPCFYISETNQKEMVPSR